MNKKDKLRPQIHAIETRLALLRQNSSLYVESNAMDSVEVLGEAWLQDKKDNSTPYDYKIVYMNEDPDRPPEQFYPDFDEAKHTHVHDYDYDPTQPMIIAADYQHSVSPICVCQTGILPGQKLPSLRYINAIHTLAPEGLEEAVKLFCDTYAGHRNKRIYYVFDQTATGKRVNADTYYKIVTDALKARGWNVQQIHTGKQPGHFQKYTDTKKWLINLDLTSTIIINAERCGKLIKSIKGAPATGKSGETKKDKRYEDTKTYPQLDQSETTHFSDVFDMINHAVFKLRKISLINSSSSGGGFGMR